MCIQYYIQDSIDFGCIGESMPRSAYKQVHSLSKELRQAVVRKNIRVNDKEKIQHPYGEIMTQFKVGSLLKQFF